jgi:hypothetical protein
MFFNLTPLIPLSILERGEEVSLKGRSLSYPSYGRTKGEGLLKILTIGIYEWWRDCYN